MRIISLCLAVSLVAVPVAAQTTGAPSFNDFVVNGGGSGQASCVPTTTFGGLSFSVSALGGSALIGAASPTCAVGTFDLGSTPTQINTVDISFSGIQFWIDGTNLFIPGNPLNALANTDASGNWSLSVTSTPSAGPIGSWQFVAVNPAYAFNAQTTQAHSITVATFPCTTLNTAGPNGDDSTLQVVLTAGMLPFYGNMYTDIWINSNGNMTFTAGDPSDFTSTEAEFLGDPEPRIAPCWEDFSPNISGQITYQEFPLLGMFSVYWENVPHFAAPAGDSNNFCCTIDTVGGIITCDWGQMDLNNGTSIDQIVGISPGSGLSGPNNLDLSAGPATGGTPMTAMYEDFGQGAFGPFDLSAANKTWTPTGGAGVGPYMVQ